MVAGHWELAAHSTGPKPHARGLSQTVVALRTLTQQTSPAPQAEPSTQPTLTPPMQVDRASMQLGVPLLRQQASTPGMHVV